MFESVRLLARFVSTSLLIRVFLWRTNASSIRCVAQPFFTLFTPLPSHSSDERSLTIPLFTHRTMPHVMVISSEGYLYLYSIDLENGGECGLVKQYSLLDSVDVDPTSDVPEPSGGKS
ncbi:hypothetical protein FA13DRAFT_1737677 [Coprinellus micaceus]|uniref:Cleavage/polyadenylation specificity factor A subunit N-terminal domain-containing protein n=1 Tax=Coprinellus micaceus TaxID=71717 RepID=A0A4Y7SWS2_COPMI|nr:hypothetical protein FA13DRAFT_1737677 [Coprinellus micaceus]